MNMTPVQALEHLNAFTDATEANNEALRVLKLAVDALDNCDTAFATLNIGRDHGITPQAASACRRAWADAQEALGRDIVNPNKIRENAFRDSLCV